ncbi:MAG: NlpC/P60 family protein [Balneolales bacterium]|nr:NlpC/P60 family protein [Balneolales bacterium]
MRKQYLLRLFSVLALVFLVFACSSSRKAARSPEGKLMNALEQWKGTPYVLGGTNRSGIDCSAFVQVVMRSEFGINLPRTTADQLGVGIRVRRSRLRAGDLVFFQTGRTTRHVGIMVNRKEFLHASTSSGPMISSLDERYWSQRYMRARRVM